MLEPQLDHLLDLLDLLVQPADHVVGAVRHLLHHHERDERVDRGGEHLLELVGVGEEGDALADGELADVHVVGDVDDCAWSQRSAGLDMEDERGRAHRTVFAFRMDFDQHLLGPHDFDDFTHVRSGLL